MTMSRVGVSEFSVDLDTQEVLVTGTMPYEDVLARIKKTGKEVSYSTFTVTIR
jgi:copper chaperone